jgi:hypothetical protein
MLLPQIDVKQKVNPADVSHTGSSNSFAVIFTACLPNCRAPLLPPSHGKLHLFPFMLSCTYQFFRTIRYKEPVNIQVCATALSCQQIKQNRSVLSCFVAFPLPFYTVLSFRPLSSGLNYYCFNHYYYCCCCYAIMSVEINLALCSIMSFLS